MLLPESDELEGDDPCELRLPSLGWSVEVLWLELSLFELDELEELDELLPESEVALLPELEGELIEPEVVD